MVPWLALVVAQLGGGHRRSRGRQHHRQPGRVPSARSVELGGHVQRTPAAPGGHEVGRVLSLRHLVADRATTWPCRPGVRAGRLPAVGEGGAAVELPVYASWTFQTGAAGTFETLAEALHAADEHRRLRSDHDRRRGGRGGSMSAGR